MEGPEPSTVWAGIAGVIGALGTAFAGWRMVKKDVSNSAVSEASNEANIAAIETYKELVESERAARIRSDERADRFAEERNTSQRDLYQALGKIDLLTAQVAALTAELQQVRDMLRTIQGAT